MIFRLDERLIFPNPELAEEDGLLAIGGDLSPERLMLAYQNSIFPWYGEDEPILWYSPHQRFVLLPQTVHISKSMRRVLNRREFVITTDTSFGQVIGNCALIKREGQDGTWITKDMQEAYTALHNLGHAHSYEVWQNGALVGGLYGVATGKVFCAESMFSKVSNASKMALIALCRSGIYDLIDCQVYTAHLASLGAKMIGRDEYMRYLNVSD